MDEIRDHVPRHERLVCVDSDGCVFDTMEAKQKRCFHGLIVSHWGLEAIETVVRETAEFAALYSRTRGNNRFLCLCRIFDLLDARPEVARAGVALPRLTALRHLVASGRPLGHPTLEAAISESGDEELVSLLEWSEAVNRCIAEKIVDVPPFEDAREGLEAAAHRCDLMVVSQTPHEALAREWAGAGLDGWVFAIAGQERGTKAEQIAMAAEGRYEPRRVLMVGDAIGDLDAARARGACFFPIYPRHEAASWRRFRAEALSRFVGEDYAGAYEDALVAEFEALLPSEPTWERNAETPKC